MFKPSGFEPVYHLAVVVSESISDIISDYLEILYFTIKANKPRKFVKIIFRKKILGVYYLSKETF